MTYSTYNVLNTLALPLQLQLPIFNGLNEEVSRVDIEDGCQISCVTAPFWAGNAVTMRKMFQLSQYSLSALSSHFHFLACWHFSCCSSVSSASESVTMMGTVLTFFLFFSALLPSDSLSRSLLGELVHCFLMGGSTVLLGVTVFLIGISVSLPLCLTGVSLVKVLLGDGPHEWLCSNCAINAAIELLECTCLVLGVQCFCTRDGQGSGRGVTDPEVQVHSQTVEAVMEFWMIELPSDLSSMVSFPPCSGLA